MKNRFMRIEKQALFLVILVLVVSISTGCADRGANETVLASINDYEITLSEFETQLTTDLEMNPEFSLTKESKTAYLNQMIQRELLIQEAIRLKLDRREPFIRAIERYWQSTLIRDLLQLKGQEIVKQIYLTEEEIQERYLAMKARNDTLGAMNEVRDTIIERLKNEKKTEKLKEWIEGLQRNAAINIRQELLDS